MTVPLLRFCWLFALALGLGWGVAVGHDQLVAVTGRLGSSVVLVFAAVSALGSGDRLIRFVCAGIGLGTLGDFFNAGLLVTGDQATLMAMVAFGLGHLCYIAGLLDAVWHDHGDSHGKLVVPTMGWLLLGVVGWWIVVADGANVGDGSNEALSGLVAPALGYTLLLAGTAGIATGAARIDRAFRGLAFGAALFLVSDLILAIELFRGPFPHDTVAVWIPYGSGQMLIVFTALAMASTRSSNSSREAAATP